RSPFSAHISGVSHDDACLPEPTNAPRAAPAPRSQPWHVRCADRWIWHRRRAVLLRVAADEAARGRRAGLLWRFDGAALYSGVWTTLARLTGARLEGPVRRGVHAARHDRRQGGGLQHAKRWPDLEL